MRSLLLLTTLTATLLIVVGAHAQPRPAMPVSTADLSSAPVPVTNQVADDYGPDDWMASSRPVAPSSIREINAPHLVDTWLSVALNGRK